MSRLTLMCFAWTLTISTAFADNPPPISTVRTLGDLRQITPIRLVDGQSVRIAITEPFPADAGTPWRLVYCMPVDAAASGR